MRYFGQIAFSVEETVEKHLFEVLLSSKFKTGIFRSSYRFVELVECYDEESKMGNFWRTDDCGIMQQIIGII